MGEPIGQVILIYSFFIIAGTIFFKIAGKLLKKNFPKLIIIIVCLLPLLIYVPVEVKTIMHSKEFVSSKQEFVNLPLIYMKVLSFKEKKAELIIIAGKNGKHQVEYIVWLEKNNGKWDVIKRNLLWAEHGSASDFSIPPYF